MAVADWCSQPNAVPDALTWPRFTVRVRAGAVCQAGDAATPAAQQGGRGRRQEEGQEEAVDAERDTGHSLHGQRGQRAAGLGRGEGSICFDIILIASRQHRYDRATSV